MVTDIDPFDIKDDVDSLAAGDTTVVENIKNQIDGLVSEYENRISELESDNTDLESQVDELESQVDELEEELNKNNLGSLDAYASSMLQSFMGHEPNLGEVISLKEDIEKLLTTKYNISLGNL